MMGNYAWALRYLPPEIESIAEVGSRDAWDAISLSNHFSAPVVAFEPNPYSFAACERNIYGAGSSLVSVRREALSDSSGEIRFGVVKESDYPNPGASSMFQNDFTNRTKDDPDSGRGRIQSFITVKSA